MCRPSDQIAFRPRRSTGFSVLIPDAGTKARIKEIFLRENEKAAAHYSGPRGMLYRSLKLEGIEEAPVNLCVTADRTRSGPHVLGRNTIVDTDLYSTCCAIENLWLAARVEGIGVGWVSILSTDEFRKVLSIPEHIVMVAYLCLGYAQEFFDEPELQRRRWANRIPLSQLVYRERGIRLPEQAGLAVSPLTHTPMPGLVHPSRSSSCAIEKRSGAGIPRPNRSPPGRRARVSSTRWPPLLRPS
jgi:5,6-dimethylbenzimidazole synthase